MNNQIGTYETTKHEQIRIEQVQAKNGREMFLLTLNQDWLFDAWLHDKRAKKLLKAIEREEGR